MVIYMNILNLKNNKLLPFYSWPLAALAAPRPSIWDVEMSLLGDRNGLCIWEFCVGVIFGIGWFRVTLGQRVLDYCTTYFHK